MTSDIFSAYPPENGPNHPHPPNRYRIVIKQALGSGPRLSSTLGVLWLGPGPEFVGAAWGFLRRLACEPLGPIALAGWGGSPDMIDRTAMKGDRPSHTTRRKPPHPRSPSSHRRRGWCRRWVAVGNRDNTSVSGASLGVLCGFARLPVPYSLGKLYRTSQVGWPRRGGFCTGYQLAIRHRADRRTPTKTG